ncbi:hypothetical protein VM94_05171 [Janthinobacterium sp. KBS0711]|nr:hypothetical protein VM94_05171 [Janthinobacterium sp. KBS0711]
MIGGGVGPSGRKDGVCLRWRKTARDNAGRACQNGACTGVN